ncbi:MAG: hypothetical protein II047_04570, partial [Bacteroidales bacterium]|nr:hypothetical protein [Bacteroidales bacterium]
DEKAVLPPETEYGEKVKLRVLIPRIESGDLQPDDAAVPETFARTVTDLTQNRAMITTDGTALYAEAEGKAVLI